MSHKKTVFGVYNQVHHFNTYYDLKSQTEGKKSHFVACLK